MNDLELLVTETGHIDKLLTEGESVRPGCLGQLSGPIAEWHDSTRNDRYYSKKLWMSVFETPWVQEALRTKTLFGEADHPEDRLEPSLKQAAVVLRSYQINESDETVYGVFDILDTPCGRILRTLADYGCELGVSSRGKGRLINRNGKRVVDESTYVFGGFDVVALPAVKKARQSFIKESIDTKSLHDTLVDQINECCSANDLMVIKHILDSTELDESAEYDSLINEKLKGVGNSNDTIIRGLTSDLKEAYQRIKELESQSDSANTISTEEYNDTLRLLNQVMTENQSYQSVVSSLKSGLSAKTEMVKKLTESSKVSAAKTAQMQSNTAEIEQLKNRLAESNKAKSDALKELNSLREQFKTLSTEGVKLKESVESSTGQVSELTNENTRLNTELEESVRDYNSLVDDYNALASEASVLLSRYLEQQSTKLGVSPQMLERLLPENYTVKDIDEVVASQLSMKRKLNKLPITQSTIKESVVMDGQTNQSHSDPSLDSTRKLLTSIRTKKG